MIWSFRTPTSIFCTKKLYDPGLLPIPSSGVTFSNAVSKLKAQLDAGRTIKFAPVKSLRFSELFLGILLSVGHESPPFSFFKPRK